MQREKLQVGDRVRLPGYAWKNEVDRWGDIVETYSGVPGLNTTVEFVAVKFDDGEIRRGYLRDGSLLQKVTVFPSVRNV